MSGQTSYSSPAIGAEGTIYLGDYSGDLIALTDGGTSATQRWLFSAGGGLPVNSSPVIAADGTIYVSADNGYLYAVGGPSASPTPTATTTTAPTPTATATPTGGATSATPTATATATFTATVTPTTIPTATPTTMPTATPTPSSTLALFVTNLATNDVTAYPLGSSGNIAPLASGTGLAGPFGIARDSTGNLYVANEDVDSVTIYPPGATGNSAPIATIGGANTALDNPTGITLDSNGNIYVANAGSLDGDADSVTIYPALGSSTGILNEAPTATITGATTGLAFPTAITLDSSGNIYVANSGSQVGGADSITVFPAGSNGNAAPSSTISGASTGLAVPYGIAVDSGGNIYVANDGSTIGVSDSVTVYAPGTSGNVAPGRTITGASTGLDSPGGIAVDSSGNLYVTNDGSLYGGADSITVYAPGSNGNAVPSATLFALGLDTPAGIAVDSGGNLYVSNGGSTDGDLGSVTVYPPDNTLPSATIGSDTGLDEPSGITVDSSGNIYVTNEGSITGGMDSVTVYPPGSYANVVPSAAIVGTGTGLVLPYGIATDSSGNLFVANSAGGPDGLGSVTVYPAGSNGNIAPSVTISGDSNSDNTGFNFPTGIALDSSGNLYVANVGGGPDSFGSITVYPAGSNGDVTPIATISDDPNCAPCDNTGLSLPLGIAIDSIGNIYVANVAGGPDDLGSVTVYPPLGSSTGILNEPPSATISGSDINDDNTGFDSPSGIALDSGANIYVTNNGSLAGGTDSVTVYPPLGSSIGILNEAPLATVTGFITGLGGPQGIAIGPNGGVSP